MVGVAVGLPVMGELDGCKVGDRLGIVVGGTEHSEIKP